LHTPGVCPTNIRRKRMDTVDGLVRGLNTPVTERHPS